MDSLPDTPKNATEICDAWLCVHVCARERLRVCVRIRVRARARRRCGLSGLVANRLGEGRVAVQPGDLTADLPGGVQTACKEGRARHHAQREYKS